MSGAVSDSSAATRRGEGESDLGAIAERFVAELRRGDDPPIDEYLRRHPKFARDIGALFPTIRALEVAALKRADPRVADAETPPERIGEYRIVRELGRGGMGVVLLAEQESLGRRVALKLLPPQVALDARLLERFRREARAAGRLSHPRIVQVFGVGEDHGLHYYAMQYIEGEALDRVIGALRAAREAQIAPVGTDRDAPDASRAGASPASTLVTREISAGSSVEPGTDATEDAVGACPEPRSGTRTVFFRNVARVGMQVADALAYAHARGILHRDVKPANLIVDASGSVWITDFGLCRAVDDADLSGSSDLVGTLRYMSPEQIQGQADVRSDVYGLGVTLYELLTLRPAFGHRSRARLIERVLHSDPPRPRRIVGDVPRDLESIVVRAMAKLPEERYGTAEALGDDLRAFLEHRPVVARGPGVLRLVRLAARRNRPLSVTVVGALLLLILLTGFYVVGLRSSWERETRRLYVASLAAAESALQTGDTAGAARRLAEAPADLRDWEWHHYQSRLDESLRAVARLPAGVTSVDYGPGGNRIAIGATDGLRIWNEDAGKLVRPEGGQARVVDLDFAPDGRALAVVSNDKHLRLFSLEEGVWTPLVARLPTDVYAVCFDDAGERIAVSLLDATVRVFDRRLKELRVYSGNEGRMQALAFDATGRRLVGGTLDGTVRVLDLRDGSVVSWPGHERSVRDVAIDPEHARIATCSLDGTASVWNLETGAEIARLRGHTDDVTGVLFLPDGRRVVTASKDRTIRVWDVESAREMRVLRGAAGSLFGLALHPDGHRLVTGSWDGVVREWDVDAGGGITVLRGQIGPVWDLAFSPDGEQLASVGRDCTVRVWNAVAGCETRVLIGHELGVRAVAFSPDGLRLASGDLTGTVRLWDVSTGETVHRIAGPEGSVLSASRAVWDICFHPDGSRLFVSFEDRTVRVWTLLPEPVLEHVIRLPSAGRSLAVDPRGRVIAIGLADGGVRFHEADGYELRAEHRAHQDVVTSLSFRNDGGRLASVSYDRTLVLWDPESGTPTATFPVESAEPVHETNALERVAFTADGARIVVGSRNTVVSLWDPVAEEQVATLHGHGAVIACSPVGGRIAAGRVEIRVLDTVSAAQRVERVRRERVAHGGAARLVAELHEEVGDWSVVFERLRASPGLTPAELEAALAAAYSKRGEMDSLFERSRKVLLAPDRAVEEVRLAYGLVRGLAHAAGTRPRHQAARGAGLHRLGEQEEALRFLEMANGMLPADEIAPEWSAFLAMTRARLGRIDEARAVLDRARERAARAPEVEPAVRALLDEARETIDRAAETAAAAGD